MANMANSALQKCPNTKIALSGYCYGRTDVVTVANSGDPGAGGAISSDPGGEMLLV